MKNLLVALLILGSFKGVEAKRAPVQLMPNAQEDQTVAAAPKEISSFQRKSASAPPSQVLYGSKRSPYDRGASQMGLEFGIVGRQQSTDPDLLGVQALLGGRAFLWLPLYGALTLKPSLGFFYKKESVGSVSVSQAHLEGGVGFLFSLIEGDNFKWHLGLSNRLARTSSTSVVFSNETSNPENFFFRSGPTTGILIRLGTGFHLVSDFEYTWSFEKPTRRYMGFSSGLGFEI